MPPSSRVRRKTAGLVLLAALLLSFSCGTGEDGFSTLEIEKAGWSGERIMVTGSWARGVTTPPLCRVIGEPGGSASEHFAADARVELEGNAFSKEFVPLQTNGGVSPPEPRDAYYVRCTSSGDSGKSSEAVARVAGEF